MHVRPVAMTFPLAMLVVFGAAFSQGHESIRSEIALPTPSPVNQMPGYPITIPAEGFTDLQWNFRGLVLADLDGNHSVELVYSSQRGRIYNAEQGTVAVWDSTGHMVPGFPIILEGGAFFAPSVGDLDGDGSLEIVQTTIDLDNTARVYAIDRHGAVLPGFPIVAGSASVADGATLYDMDNDGKLEIIYTSRFAAHVYEPDASEWSAGWPVTLQGSSSGTPAVGDVDFDGAPEVFIVDDQMMHLLKRDGSELPGWPISLGERISSPVSTAALADLDHDRNLEIVVPLLSGPDFSSLATEIYVLHHDGQPMQGWPQTQYLLRTDCPPIVTDLEGNGRSEILIATEIRVEEEGPYGTYTLTFPQIWAWHADGGVVEGFPWQGEEGRDGITLLTTADMDGDGYMEIFSDSWGREDYQGYILGIDSKGLLLPGFPLRTVGESWPNGAVLADVDQDGDLELGAISFNDEPGNATVHINLFDLGGSFRPSARDWPTYHRRNTRGGLLEERYRGWRVVYADRSGNASDTH